MAGHSKWSKVKHIKGPLDQKRGQLFSKLAKEISVAARLGGGDPDASYRLRSAILAARSQSMPNDNIERAIKRDTGKGHDDAEAEALREAGITAESQKLTFVPETHVQVSDPDVSAQVLRLIDALEDSDDVQHVHANFAAREEALANSVG